MSAEKIMPTAETIERAESNLGDICQYMLSIKHILGAIGAEGKFDHFHTAIEVMANRTGALSDSILKDFGRIQNVGNHRDWFGNA